MCDRIKVVKEYCVDDLHNVLTGEALSKWNDADWQTKEAVFERVLSSLYRWDTDSETQNDMICSDCNDLFYPPKFTVKVWRLTDDEDETTTIEPIEKETFSGLDSKMYAAMWCDDFLDGADDANYRIVIVNEDDGTEIEYP